MAKWVLILVALSLNCAEQDFDYENDQDIYNEYNYYDEGEGDMALNFSTLAELVGRHVPPDGDYPYGSAQDETTGGADDGTPQIAKLRNDVQGFLQGLLQKAGIVPDGDPDVAAGQYREALDTMPISLTQLADGSTSITNGTRTLTIDTSLVSLADSVGGIALSRFEVGQVYNRAYEGATYQLSSAIKDGGVNFSGTTPGTAVTTRRNSFVMDVAKFSSDADGFVFYGGAGEYLELAGIPASALIQGLFIDLEYAGNRNPCSVHSNALPVSAGISNQRLSEIECMGTNFAGITPTSATLYIDYDPTSVD